ncbi:MAG: glycoside hydrolase family 172 protein [Phycisphaerales bacterium]
MFSRGMCRECLVSVAVFAALLTGPRGRAQEAGTPAVSLASLLRDMVDRDNLARWPSPEYGCAQFSSYDRASTDPSNAKTWFANGDVNQYLRQEKHGSRTEWVMMDADGPGAVVRIWSANPKGTLRVYLDGSDVPVIEGTMSDVLGGKWRAPDSLSYEASKGWNLYLPIPYAKHCTITSDRDGFYYQVNYRTYAPGTAVETLSAAGLKAAGAEIARVGALLVEDRRSGFPKFEPGERGVMNGAELQPGDSVALALPAGSCAITGMMLKIESDDPEQASRSCVIRAEFDGEACVWCPVGDFFGSGVGFTPYQDWYRAVGADGMMRCRWVMPYRQRAALSIVNHGTKVVRVDARARVKPWEWDDRSMHFHAAWRDEYPVRAYGAKGTSDFNYVDVNGKGVYVGDVLSIMNPVKDWWGEGDEKIYVDGEKFPSHFGTGTEDYYGYAWCWPAKFSRPFHAQSRCDGEEGQNNWGRTTVTRSRALDAIPFRSSLSMNIEVWHWKECDVEYATTAYFYAMPGATTNRVPLAEAAGRALVKAPPLPPPLKVAGAIECETLPVTGKTEGIVVGAQGGFGPDLWSGAQQLWVQARQIGDFVEITAPAAAKSRVLLYATRSWDYGIVRVSVNGARAGEDLDLCSGKREVLATGPIELGVFEPRDGALVIRAEVVGSNPKSEKPGTFFGLDCIVLEPVKP